MTKQEFYQRHLDRVSRSFAYCIARLDGPLRGWVSLTYLICRVLDTVEDAKWLKKTNQMESFLGFERIIQSPEHSSLVGAWMNALPKDLPAGEVLLIKDSNQLFSDLHEAPPSVREIIQTLAGSMARGMRHFVSRSRSGELKLNNLQEVNQYCFFVAGIVGEALSQLLAAADHRLRLTKHFLVNAHHFGLFLQKVNLLKDQAMDEKEGRFLISSREEVFHSLKANAEGAMAYIEAIPIAHRSYRYFCSVSLFLGLATLPLLKKRAGVKISRFQAAQLFSRLEGMMDKPEVLRELFESHMKHAKLNELSLPLFESAMDAQWIQSAYAGSLDNSDLQSLCLA